MRARSILAGFAVLAAAGCGDDRDRTASSGSDRPATQPASPATAALPLRRSPYLGLRCPQANSIACDRVGLAVWPKTKLRRLSATIDGRQFALRAPTHPGGFWDGKLQPAGLLDPASALHVTPDRGRHYWAGAHPVRVVVHLAGEATNGAPLTTRTTVDLHAGYG